MYVGVLLYLMIIQHSHKQADGFSEGFQKLLRYFLEELSILTSLKVCCIDVQSTLFIQTFNIMAEFVILTVWMEWFLSSRWGRKLDTIKNYIFNTPRNTCWGDLLESPRQGNSNKYSQHMFLGVNKEQKAFYHYSYWYMFFFLAANSF